MHVRGDNGRVSPHTIYVALGVNLEGKECSACGWRKTKGRSLVACVDRHEERGLNDISWPAWMAWPDSPRRSRGLPADQGAALRRASRAALQYVNAEDGKPVARDLKKIYQAATLIEAEPP